jgi:hypothetical protein
MERKNTKLKNAVVVGFAILSMFLVMNIWFDQFVNAEEELPSYIRSTLNFPTPQGFELTLAAQPTREHGQGPGSGQGSGQGSGSHEETPSPTPTFDVNMWTPEPDISDDLADE